MGNAVSLNAGRDAVKLLSGLMKEAKVNGKVTKDGVETLISDYGLDSDKVIADALTKIYGYASARYGKDELTMRQINSALSTGMKAIAKSDANDNEKVDPAEFKKLAATWKAIMRFGRDYQGYTVDQIKYRGHE